MAMTAGELRSAVLEELESIGFRWDRGCLVLPDDQTKALAKTLHQPARETELERRHDWLARTLPRYLHYFADGTDVIPDGIRPQLIEVRRQWHRELFRIARLTWSLPYSKGFGRRLTFLVMDASNGKLIGILRLQSPPISFPSRDRIFPCPDGQKTFYVNQTMDIHTLGSLPPYNRLLGGKLVAMAAASNEVRAAYRRKYAGRTTEMEQRVLPPHLVALTTTSAFGRSSIYNRLSYGDDSIAESLGYTEGYGTFHLLRLYPLFRDFLEEQGISTRGGYGTGPRRKWQTMVRALGRIGFSSDLLKHGIRREAFVFPLIENLPPYLAGTESEPAFRDLPFDDLSVYWRERWLLPRAERVDGWRTWDRVQIKAHLGLENTRI
jgi:hypothetical protein